MASPHSHHIPYLAALKKEGIVATDAANPMWVIDEWKCAMYMAGSRVGFYSSFGRSDEAWIWQPPHQVEFGYYTSAREYGKSLWRWCRELKPADVPRYLEVMRLCARDERLSEQRKHAIDKVTERLNAVLDDVSYCSNGPPPRSSFSSEVKEQHPAFELSAKRELGHLYRFDQIEHHRAVKNEHGRKSTIDFVLWDNKHRSALVVELKKDANQSGLMECREQVRVLSIERPDWQVRGLFINHNPFPEMIARAKILREYLGEMLFVAGYEKIKDGMSVKFLDSTELSSKAI